MTMNKTALLKPNMWITALRGIKTPVGFHSLVRGSRPIVYPWDRIVRVLGHMMQLRGTTNRPFGLCSWAVEELLKSPASVWTMCPEVSSHTHKPLGLHQTDRQWRLRSRCIQFWLNTRVKRFHGQYTMFHDAHATNDYFNYWLKCHLFSTWIIYSIRFFLMRFLKDYNSGYLLKTRLKQLLDYQNVYHSFRYLLIPAFPLKRFWVECHWPWGLLLRLRSLLSVQKLSQMGTLQTDWQRHLSHLETGRNENSKLGTRTGQGQ